MIRLTINPSGHPLDMTIHPQCTLPHGVPILPCTSGQIVWGDLHGDSVKLLYLLVSHGLLSISIEDYSTLTELFSREPDQINEHHFITILTILNPPRSILHRGAKLILIGDEVCDRGNNDLFTLILLEKMKHENLNFEILLSNHGMAFFLSRANNDTLTDIHPKQARSYLNYLKLKKALSASLGPAFDELLEEIIKGYASKLRPIAYLQGILFVHAPCGYELFENLDRTFWEIPDDIPNTKIHKIIHLIRKKFKSMTMSDILARATNEDVNNRTPSKPSPDLFFRYITWNRNMLGLKLFLETKQVVHGHHVTTPSHFYPDGSPLSICIDDHHRKKTKLYVPYDTNEVNAFVSEEVALILKHNIAAIREERPRAKAGAASAPPEIHVDSDIPLSPPSNRDFVEQPSEMLLTRIHELLTDPSSLDSLARDRIIEDNKLITQLSCGCIEDQYQFLNTHPDLLDIRNPKLERLPQTNTIVENVLHDVKRVRNADVKSTLEFLSEHFPRLFESFNREFLQLEQQMRNNIVNEIDSLFEEYSSKKIECTSSLFASTAGFDFEGLKNRIKSELESNGIEQPKMILERFITNHLIQTTQDAADAPLRLKDDLNALISKYYRKAELEKEDLKMASPGHSRN